MSTPDPHPTLPFASPAVLVRAYRRSGDVRLRDRLVFTLAPLVRHAGAADDAAAGAGLEALVDAVEAFEPERDGPIEQFAWARVREALGASMVPAR